MEHHEALSHTLNPLDVYPLQHRAPEHSPYDITSPPQASINPTLSRRRSDYVDQTQEATQGFHRPGSTTQTVIVRPPPVASSALVAT
ncbi:uncharacterized protein LACBIDRAFT_305143 [Laccaria bicolor S238N-H82]|uniref:Predicted protein n=1 Tax=Laccaria bicolor (strain S238N-H82 / ATCC MYA-4686) TaxID=486041 RepID=B0CTI4_LACBS|nr:uncharacterized protein LACBIDRAFT_305143 [Laccaria bicolor S238N-H82]EDR14494.1 predicted protein [Laccaria bicolor S238N-H82]|eukprot:XP_001875053.1 predicted protein [Laccaria bicolor S238N-H82]